MCSIPQGAHHIALILNVTPPYNGRLAETSMAHAKRLVTSSQSVRPS
jgi:hypothetical protein